jgi:hypothetical protein
VVFQAIWNTLGAGGFLQDLEIRHEERLEICFQPPVTAKVEHGASSVPCLHCCRLAVQRTFFSAIA